MRIDSIRKYFARQYDFNTTPSAQWMRRRVGYIAGTLLVPLVIPFAEPSMGWIDYGAMFGFGVIGLLFVVGIQAFNPYSDKHWFKPSWYQNPSNPKQPLQFFHLAAHSFLAMGMSSIAIAFLRHEEVSTALAPLAIGLGLWLGVWFCVFVFRHKMRSIEPRSAGDVLKAAPEK